MSSAANDKRGKLEEEFRNRMSDAEASPSQDLWPRIDHELTVQENGLYKKSAVFYRQLAAACITLLLLAGGLGAYFFSGAPATQPQLAVAPAAVTEEASVPVTAPAVKESLAGAAATADNASAETGNIAAEPAVPVAIAQIATPNAIAAAPGSAARSITHTTTPVAEAASAPLYNFRNNTPERATNAIAGAGENNPETAQQGSSAIYIYRSLRQSITTMSIAGNSTTKPGLAGQPLTATAAQAPEADFRKLNEQVMAQARQQEEEQKALVLAQNQETANSKKSGRDDSEADSRWSVGMAYAPGYFEQNIGIPNQMAATTMATRQSLVPSGALAMSSLYMDEAREEYVQNTDPGFSFGFEVKAGLKLAKKLKLLAGLGFTQNTSRSKSSYVIEQFRGRTFAGGYESKGASTIFLPSINSDFASDSLHVAKTSEYNVNYRYRHLTIPVGLQYEGNINNDWFWYGGAGVAANILMQTTILASASDVRNVDYDADENSPFRKLQWSGNVSAGVGKRLANNFSVTIGPEFRGYLDTMLADPENALAPQGKPYTMGLNMAVSYDLSPGKKSRKL